MALEGVFGQLESLGLFDVLLPFMLVFTLVYAILNKVHIFGGKDDAEKQRNKPFHVVIALVMGLAVVFPHVLGYYPPEQDIVNIINQAIPNVSVVLVAILMALLIIGLLGKRFQLANGSLSGWIAIAAFGIVVYIFGAAADWWHLPDWLAILNNPDTMALVIVILVFAIIIWFITKGPETEAQKAAREASRAARKAELAEMLKDP